MRHKMMSDDTTLLSSSTVQSLHGIDNKENLLNDLYPNVEMSYESGKESILKVEVLDAAQNDDRSKDCVIANDALLHEQIFKEGFNCTTQDSIVDHDLSDDSFASIINLAKLVDSLDVYSLMQVVEAKILEHFSSWDLIVRRARLYQLTSQDDNIIGMLQYLVTEIESLLSQISDVLTECMEPYVEDGKTVDNIINQCVNEYVKISELLSAALGLTSGTWKRSKKIGDVPMQFRNLFEATDKKLSEPSVHGRVRQRSTIPKRCQKIKKTSQLHSMNDEKLEVTMNSTELESRSQSKDETEPNQFEMEVADTNHVDEIIQSDIKHQKIITIKKRKICDNKEKLTNYERDVENYDKHKEYKLVCKVCGTPILNEQTMQKHKTYCNGMSQTRISYERVSEQRFRCKMGTCMEIISPELSNKTSIEKAFKKESDVITHCYLSHYDNETRASVCQECGMKFASPKHRIQHFARVHDKKYICSLCGKRFFREAMLEDHMVTHTGEKVICDIKLENNKKD